MHYHEYRMLQEQRFSNNTGTSFTETIFLSQIPTFTNFLSLILVPIFHKNSNSYVVAILQCIYTFIPHILLLTVCSEYLNLFFVFLCLSICVLLIYVSLKVNIRQRVQTVLKHITIADSKLPCITSYRAIVNSFSIVCILAADFTCFPRKYLKTDIQGYGLMDTGVGLYVITSALGNSHFIKPQHERKFRIIYVMYALKKVLPLIVIGIGRFIATTAVNYHHSVSEYGVHWNFFISLSVLTFFNEILVLFVHKISTVVILIGILLPLQQFLFNAGLQAWINGDSPRDGFISANREGIFSLLGYEIIYLSGLVIKHLLPRRGDVCKKYFNVVYLFVSSFIIFSILTTITEYYFGVSRKLANCCYVFWILSITLLSLTNLIVQELFIYVMNSSSVEAKQKVNVVSNLWQAINRNGLIFFLTGNLLTGLINICIQTLTLNSVGSILIIIFYTFTCCLLVIHLQEKNVRLK